MSQDFELRLACVLAHSAVYFAREECPYDFRCEDDPKAKTPTKMAYDLAAALGVSLPTTSVLSNAQIAPTEQALLSAAQQTSPGFASLQSQITGQAMQDLATQRAQLAGGAGKNEALALDALARQIDPELYAARSATGGVIGNAAGQLNNLLTKPVTESELSAIERGLNRLNTSKGLTNAPSNLSTISNAMTFGQAGRDRLTQALQLATGFVPAATSFMQGAKTYDKSTTGDVASAVAASGGPRSLPTLGGTTSQTTGQLLGATTGNQQQAQELNMNRLTGWEKALAAMPNVNVSGGGGY